MPSFVYTLFFLTPTSVITKASTVWSIRPNSVG